MPPSHPYTTAPRPLAVLRHFFPGWSVEECIAAYAILGGVPAYWNWVDPTRSLSHNLRQIVAAPGSMFLAEPAPLLYDEVREPSVYLAILQAIGAGYHTLKEVGAASLLGSAHLSAYLATLQALPPAGRRCPPTRLATQVAPAPLAVSP